MKNLRTSAITRILFLLFSGVVLTAASVPARVEFSDKVLNQTAFLGGKELRLHHKGPVLVQFWASWCNRCSTMFEDLAQFAADHPGLAVVALSIDEDESAARNYLTKHAAALRSDMPLSLRHDRAGLIAKIFQINAVPTVLLISNDGTVLSKTSGHLKKPDLLRIASKLPL